MTFASSQRYRRGVEACSNQELEERTISRCPPFPVLFYLEMSRQASAIGTRTSSNPKLKSLPKEPSEFQKPQGSDTKFAQNVSNRWPSASALGSMSNKYRLQASN